MDPILIADLSGDWSFAPEGGRQTVIRVPGGGWLKQGFDCEAGTYERRITVPDSGRPQSVFLELGAVNHLAEVLIGQDESSLQLIHSEVTAFTPQSADLTAHVEAGGSYLIRIFVRAYENGRPIAPHWAEWCGDAIARGIFRSARLAVYPDVFISDAFVRTSVADHTMTCDTWITNTSPKPATVSLSAGISSWNGDGFRYPALPKQVLIVPAGATVLAELGTVGWLEGPESYWWPNVPYREGYRARLHTLSLTLREGNAPLHEAQIRFGFREVRQEGAHFTLNGLRVNFRGDNLQVANYDRIDNGGKGDAIDTLPGFLPPSDGNPGWPKAVDNFLRLNYNVQRTHMGPWSPYMLDTCDELGLMLIGESACRWDGFDMDNGRGPHEVKCLQDIVRRDRNHPSIVRWSSKNEAQSQDPDYHLELYEAVKALDPTRPVFEDYLYVPGGVQEPTKVFEKLLDKPDFTWMDHYFHVDEDGQPRFSAIQFSDAMLPMLERPYGVTEADWMRSSTPAGLAWFAATVALGRARGASDMRPYVLCSSWVSGVPGVRTTDLLTEENRHPVLGEDNLPDPWAHPGIQLLQKAYHPLLAMDYEFWWLNRKSDMFGHFPVAAPVVQASAEVTREITLFNDEFTGEELELFWEVREGSNANWVWARGHEKLSVKRGFTAIVPVRFSASKFNTYLFLTLRVVKDGIERFTDASTCFEVAGGEDFRSEFNGEERIFH